ncbi:MAG: hypothetical protein KDD27_08300 [Saprospiraceae bacterium]|nr:hypothetical protein [Saprospiraceae bacterium]
MQLDRNFVKSLSPALADVLPHGGIKAIADKIGCISLTARHAIHGASTNETVVKEALKSILQLNGNIEAILEKVPRQTLEKLREELRLESLGTTP